MSVTQEAILIDQAFFSHTGTFGAPSEVGRKTVTELPPDVYDPEQPTVAIYAERTFTGAEFLSTVACRLRAEGVPTPNFVSVINGIYSETFTDSENGSSMFIDSGYTFDSRGVAVLFQLDEPIRVDAVDIGQSNGVVAATKMAIDSLGITALRPSKSFEYEDKYASKRLLEKAGINVPRGFLLPIEDIPEDLPTYFRNGFVVKPSRGAQGAGVCIFPNRFSQEMLDESISKLWVYGGGLVVEEYIDGLALETDDFPDGSSWNFRATGFNGYCGGYGRVNSKGSAVNIARGGKPMTAGELLGALADQNDLSSENLLQSIVDCTDRVCEAIPDTAIGLDIVIDKRGQAYVFETNIEDFGALDHDSFDESDRIEAAVVMIKNIAAMLRTHGAGQTINYAKASPFCVVDRPSRLFHSLYSSQELSDACEIEGAEGLREYLNNNAELVNQVIGAMSEQYYDGDQRYTISVMDFLRRLAIEAEHNDLVERLTNILSSTVLGASALSEEKID